MKLVGSLLNAIITCLRPLLGPFGCCRFELSCTNFARMELKDKTLANASWSIIKRVMVCSPLGSITVATWKLFTNRLKIKQNQN